MEITYDTGARVILQGPVTYEVESKDGGFLSLGKLTARLEKRAEGKESRVSPLPPGEGQGVRAARVGSPIRPHPSPLPRGEGTEHPSSPFP